MNTTTVKKKYNRYGDGSIYQRKSDGRWITKYRPKNTVKYITKSSKTEKEAKEKLKELKRLETLGIQLSQQHLSVLMDNWLETFRMPMLKRQAYDTEESSYLCHIKPYIGEYQPHQITSTMLQKLINSRAEKLGYNALSKVFRILKQFFNFLASEKIIDKNPMNVVSMPRESNTRQIDNPIYYLEIDEVQKIEKVILSEVAKAWETNLWGKNIVARYGFIVLFLINTGLRKGEMLALKWDDLLYDKQAVDINKSLSLVKNRNNDDAPKNIWEVGTPKSKKSIRFASFNKKARHYMQELLKIQNHLNYADKNYIARTPNGKPLSKSTWTLLLKNICQLANIQKPISPHELRHTYATICIAKGVNVWVVAERMGHSSLEQTHRYVHLLKEQINAADDLIENLI